MARLGSPGRARLTGAADSDWRADKVDGKAALPSLRPLEEGSGAVRAGSRSGAENRALERALQYFLRHKIGGGVSQGTRTEHARPKSPSNASTGVRNLRRRRRQHKLERRRRRRAWRMMT